MILRDGINLKISFFAERPLLLGVKVSDAKLLVTSFPIVAGSHAGAKIFRGGFGYVCFFKFLELHLGDLGVEWASGGSSLDLNLLVMLQQDALRVVKRAEVVKPGEVVLGVATRSLKGVDDCKLSDSLEFIIEILEGRGHPGHAVLELVNYLKVLV